LLSERTRQRLGSESPRRAATEEPGDRLQHSHFTANGKTGLQFRYPSGAEALVLRIVLLCLVILVIVLFVPRLLSRSQVPAEGSAAPDFALTSQDGSLVSLKDYRGKWVVLYFYLKDQTPG
jgi:AhpC/TSA family